MQNNIEPLKRPPLLYHSVQEAIRDYIINNHLQPGDPLPPETELARKLGVSRNSVREAAKSLESLGVIETRRGSGLFVQDFSFDPILDNLQYGFLFKLEQLAELWQIRQVLERGMIEAAIQSMTEEQHEALQKIIERMWMRAEKGESIEEEDREFHQRLFEQLGNKVLLKLLDIFWLTFYKAAAEHSNLWDDNPVWGASAHAAIVDAVIKGDVEQAKKALDEHYMGLEDRLTAAQKKQDIT